MMFATQTVSKSAKHMVPAFERLFRQMPRLPEMIFSDKGTEFLAREVLAQMKDKRIQKYEAHSPDVKAAVAERAIRTIKGRLYKQLTFQESNRWVDVFPKIIASINQSVCRVTGKRPIDVNESNAQEIWDRLYRHAPVTSMASKYDVGDKVRIAKQKKHFEKSYLPNYTQEVFEVEKVIRKRRPKTTQLKNTEGNPIVGKFYDTELSRTKSDRDPKLVIDQVLQTRIRRVIKEYLVRWRNKPVEHNTWITEADVID